MDHKQSSTFALFDVGICMRILSFPFMPHVTNTRKVWNIILSQKHDTFMYYMDKTILLINIQVKLFALKLILIYWKTNIFFLCFNEPFTELPLIIAAIIVSCILL